MHTAPPKVEHLSLFGGSRLGDSDLLLPWLLTPVGQGKQLPGRYHQTNAQRSRLAITSNHIEKCV